MVQEILKNKISDCIVDKYLPELFNSYCSIDNNTPSSWVVWTEDCLDIHLKTLRVCHSDMVDLDSGFDHLITAMPNKKPIDVAYQRMLISGPFKGWSDLISIESIDGQYFIHCSDLDKWPANVLYNYCIATRVPIEHRILLFEWDRLVKSGVGPTMAFLLSYLHNVEEIGEHLWFDTTSDWLSILRGEVCSSSDSFKIDPSGCTPCNIIWGRRNNKFMIEMTDEEIIYFYGVEKTSQVIAPSRTRRNKGDKLIDIAPAEPVVFANIGDEFMPQADIPQVLQQQFIMYEALINGQ